MEFQTNQNKVETKKCKHCGMDIPAQAKVCPYCNKKQSHTVRNVSLIILGVIVLLVVLFSCMGGNKNDNSNSGTTATTDTGSSTQTDSATTGSNNSSTSNNSAQETQNYTVGSTFTADDITATLNSVTTSYGNDFSQPEAGYVYLITNWTVTNNGSEEFNPFGFSTSGYVDGTTVEGAISALPDQFDMGTMIIPGSSTTGNKVYEVPEGWQEFQIRVQLGTIGGDTAIFKVTPNQVS